MKNKSAINYFEAVTSISSLARSNGSNIQVSILFQEIELHVKWLIAREKGKGRGSVECSYAYTGWLRARRGKESMYVLSRMRQRGREESEKDKQSPLSPCMRRAKSADNEGQRRHFSCHVFSWAIFILWGLCSTAVDPREILFPVRRGRSNSHERY